MATKKTLYAVRDFNDAGTGERFTRGDDISNAVGIDNYAAAGLASEEKPKAGATPAAQPDT